MVAIRLNIFYEVCGQGMTYDKIPLSKINDRGSLVMETLRYSIMLKCMCV